MDSRLSDEAVENLVTQFSSALDFYRELVQNSIDAGTSGVEVWLEYEEGDGTEGVIGIHVDDFGEGMNEEIIDGQLTRLFSSTKENDLTKIGKFGIGFVSVFALKPAGVLLRTGREGEFWEVFFHEDRSFTKTRITEPVEGTQITLFLGGDRARYDELVTGSKATLSRWCSHSETDVTFEDRSPATGDVSAPESINAPFVAEGHCRVEVTYPGTELALAYSTDPLYGFYNKGLALAVTRSGEDVLGARATRLGHVAFKIKSRYLEHTLSRETVMQDGNYEKAMAMLEQAADGQLRRQLLADLADLAQSSQWTIAQSQRYEDLLAFLAVEPPACFGADFVRRAPILRTVGGHPRSLRDVEKTSEREGRIFVAASPSELTASLEGQGIPVFLGSAGGDDDAGYGSVTLLLARYMTFVRADSVTGFIRGRLGADHYAEALDSIKHPEEVLVTVSIEEGAPAPVRDLIARAADLLKRSDAGYSEIVPGRIQTDPERPLLFVLGREFASVMAKPHGATYTRGLLERPRVVVNRHHSHFRALLELYEHSAPMAAYCLAKSLLLEEDRVEGFDAKMIESATAHARPR